jgi:hypothetical protein
MLGQDAVPSRSDANRREEGRAEPDGGAHQKRPDAEGRAWAYCSRRGSSRHGFRGGAG